MFKSRRYGWGWTPCSPEGWIVAIGSATAFLGGAAIVRLAADPAAIAWRLGFLPHLRLGTLAGVWLVAWNGLIGAATIAICWKTGERPRWRWGK